MPPNLPLGYRFKPTDLELIEYLQLKVLGKQLPSSDAVIEGEVCGDDAQLPAVDIGNRELHKFAKNTKSQYGTRTNRRTKGGFWRVKDKGEKIKDESGNHIGSMRALELVETIESGRKKKLLMVEYTLAGSLEKRNSEGWVLCKIKQGNKSPKRHYAREEGDGSTSRPTASPALQGINNRSSNFVIADGDCVDMDSFWESMEDNQAMAECPSEPAGGPIDMQPDQRFEYLTNHGQGPPTLGGFDYNCENDDGYRNNENFVNELYFRYE